VKLELSEGQLRLSSNNPDLGDAREELDIDYAGETTSIAFNARYLIDAVSAARSKEIRFGSATHCRPRSCRRPTTATRSRS
jgi:DNA polymerase-3 subunit beta